MIAVWTCRVLGGAVHGRGRGDVRGRGQLTVGELHVGPLHLMTGDHVFHVVLGSVVLLAGLLSGRQLS